ncbi:hypothetical protein PENTCL1PPCAC_1780, partial [Pristionchus entomophagus]
QLMLCPIDIVHSGVTLSPLSLFTLLTSITAHTHVHHLIFRSGDFEFSIVFRPLLTALSPPDIANHSKHLSSFCHFEGANGELHAWIDACKPERIKIVIHAPFARFTVKSMNETFQLVSNSDDNCELFNSLNIEIRLVHLKVLKSFNIANINYTNEQTIINSFKSFLHKNYNHLHFDNANLIMYG